MKRLVSKTERERKKRRNQTIVGIILIFLMGLSVLGFALQGNIGKQENENTLTYNGFEFTLVGERWKIGNFIFSYNPEQVPDMGSDLNDFTFYQELPAYVYSENSEAEIEIIGNLELVAERVQNACMKGEGFECSENVPIKTCENNFIIIKESNITSIRQEDNCVYIEGPDEELLKLADQFLFKILGIK